MSTIGFSTGSGFSVGSGRNMSTALQGNLLFLSGGRSQAFNISAGSGFSANSGNSH